MKRISIACELGDLGDGEIRVPQKLAGLVHAVQDQKFLGSLCGGFFKQFAEIAAVEVYISSQILHRNVFHIMILNKIRGRLDIEVLDIVFYGFFGRPGALYESAEKQVGMAHNLAGEKFRVVDHLP